MYHQPPADRKYLRLQLSSKRKIEEEKKKNTALFVVTHVIQREERLRKKVRYTVDCTPF
jgi:hypothetical protein